jgi:uncharacterized BrkB/YihY/UPF0761 family membrane protein
MSSVVPVPELALSGLGRLAARDAVLTVRRYGVLTLAREAFSRFRYGDGFSHSRALGLQLTITTIPLVIAAIGLSNALRTEFVGRLLRQTLLELSPGASDALIRATISPFWGDVEGDVVALVLGLIVALTALTTAMGQVERGANRIYGILRDRPTVAKYRRAFVMALLTGLPAMAGFAVLVAADPFSEAVELLLGVDDDGVSLLVRALGAVLLIGAITIMLRHAPARQQPGWSLLALGGLVALTLWIVLTAALAAALSVAADIGTVYGPLTGVMALLLWAQLTSAAIFVGFAVSAQLEHARLRHPTAAVGAVTPPPHRPPSPVRQSAPAHLHRHSRGRG